MLEEVTTTERDLCGGWTGSTRQNKLGQQGTCTGTVLQGGDEPLVPFKDFKEMGDYKACKILQNKHPCCPFVAGDDTCPLPLNHQSHRVQ